MSSSRPGDVKVSEHPSTHADRGIRRPLTLRTKLIAGIVAVIVGLSVVIGVVSEIFLGNYLKQQLDNRVVSTQDRFGHGVAPVRSAADSGAPTQASKTATSSEPGPGDGPIIAPAILDCTNDGTGFGQRQPDDSLAALVKNGLVTKAVIRERSNTCVVLTADVAAAVAKVQPNMGVVAVEIGDYGNYHVAARQMPDGQFIVTGLSFDEVTNTQVQLALIMASVAGVAILLGAAIVFLVVRRSVRPLERVAATARKVSTLPLDKGEVDLSIRVPDRDTDTRTEVGQVGAALNQMLGHVSGALESRHASETRVRQFVADASHELRTPLATIRGYAELARRGEHDPGAVTHALRRVESESSRMTALVEDLLLLARLDSGRPLAREEVDLTMLVVDRASDARVAGPEHRWRLDLPREPVIIVGDSARLHQVLANLLANARNHTPPGTVVIIALAVNEHDVVLTVTDDGPGIPEELQPEIFGRFVRGDSSRSRAAGSTGLGLAIVAAVITAHRGTVTVDSRPGRTVATVRLPRSPAAAIEHPAAPASLSPV